MTPARIEITPTATNGTATAWPEIGHAASDIAAPNAAGMATRRSLGDGRAPTTLVIPDSDSPPELIAPAVLVSPQPLPPPTSGLSTVPHAGWFSRNRPTPVRMSDPVPENVTTVGQNFSPAPVSAVYKMSTHKV